MHDSEKLEKTGSNEKTMLMSVVCAGQCSERLPTGRLGIHKATGGKFPDLKFKMLVPNSLSTRRKCPEATKKDPTIGSSVWHRTRLFKLVCSRIC
jgi:hypothetical protein